MVTSSSGADKDLQTINAGRKRKISAVSRMDSLHAKQLEIERKRKIMETIAHHLVY